MGFKWGVRLGAVVGWEILGEVGAKNEKSALCGADRLGGGGVAGVLLHGG